MLRLLGGYSLTDELSWIAADAAAKSMLAICAAAAAALMLRRSSAAARHRLWALTLCGLIVLPSLSWLLPAVRLPFGGLARVFEPRTRAAGEADPADASTAYATRAASTGGLRETSAPGSINLRAPSTSADTLGLPRDAGFSSAASSRILVLWGLGFLVAVAPLGAGIVGNELRRRRSSLVVDPRLLGLFESSARALGMTRRVELRLSSLPTMPVTWGPARPVVLLPEQAATWSDSAVRLVLLHELAHIKRRDVGFQLTGRFAASLYWFLPPVWYALRQLRIECECACDDHVVSVGIERSEYAGRLVELARLLRPSGLAAALPASRPSTLEQRIRRLFDESRGHGTLTPRGSVASYAVVITAVIALAAIHPSAAAVGPEDDAGATQTQPAPAAPPTDQEPASTETHPITVTGRALDPAGKPIAGARIYLASLQADYKRIAETTSDVEGRYTFRAVPLPIARADKFFARNQGRFQIFGQAQGFGFAWRPAKAFYPRPAPANITMEPERRDPPGRYEAGEAIVLDLRFSPAAHLSGSVVDAGGKPLAGAKLEIRACESLKVVDNVVPGWTFDALNQPADVPPAMKVHTTDAAGRFDFGGMPEDCRFRINVRVKDYPEQWIQAATVPGPVRNHDGFPVLTGELKLTLTTPVDIPIQLVFEDTGRPAARALVQAGGGGTDSLQTTDDEGRAVLRLPPGTYHMQNWPARGTPYLVTDSELVVDAKPSTLPLVSKLRRACVLEVTVVDADTGAPLGDVDLWRRSEPAARREAFVLRSWEAPRLARRDHPRTDKSGKFRTFIEPGKHTLGVGIESRPAFYLPVEDEGRQVECRPGETKQVIFTMRKAR